MMEAPTAAPAGLITEGGGGPTPGAVARTSSLAVSDLIQHFSPYQGPPRGGEEAPAGSACGGRAGAAAGPSSRRWTACHGAPAAVPDRGPSASASSVVAAQAAAGDGPRRLRVVEESLEQLFACLQAYLPSLQAALAHPHRPHHHHHHHQQQQRQATAAATTGGRDGSDAADAGGGAGSTAVPAVAAPAPTRGHRHQRCATLADAMPDPLLLPPPAAAEDAGANHPLPAAAPAASAPAGDSPVAGPLTELLTSGRLRRAVESELLVLTSSSSAQAVRLALLDQEVLKLQRALGHMELHVQGHLEECSRAAAAAAAAAAASQVGG